MTERLYYSDSYTRKFTARVLARADLNNRPALILDQTYFYPASGGQPHDLGSIAGVPVAEVIVRESDGAVLHLLAGPLNPFTVRPSTGSGRTDTFRITVRPKPVEERTEMNFLLDQVGEGQLVECEINWPRRFDHMQQHTGQHLLSQAFIRAAEALTVSFHLGAETVTIDLDAETLAAPLIERAEQIANQAVSADYPVRAWFPAPDELARLTLRKTPDVDGPLRVIAIGDFDYNACGGTHVARAGEVGLIKILKTEKQKKGTRVEFICGSRALADYGRKHALVSRLANEFTCGQLELPDAVARLRDEAQSLRKELRAAHEALLDYEAAQLRLAAQSMGSWQVARGAWANREMVELRGLATRLTAPGSVIALLGSAGDKANLLFARSSDVVGDMNALFKAALALLPGGRGGGSATLAQGGGVSASLEQVQKVLEFAEQELRR